MHNNVHNMMQYITDDFNLSNSQSHQPSNSSHLSTYINYFQDVQQDAIHLTTFPSHLQIKYKLGFTSQFVREPQAILRQVLRGGTIAVFDVLQGPFKLELKLLVVSTLAPKATEINGGTFGKVCEVEGRGGTVCKRFQLKRKERLVERDVSSWVQTVAADQVKEAVLECSLVKICSMLGIGPQYHFFMGFDLILFDDCIEFYMEKCRKFDDRPKKLSFQQIEFSLKKRVRAMHMMCFTHKDIKPSNVLYSSTKQELVLCDFGISTFLTQKLGWKSLTFCEGTKYFMSDQMKSLSKNRAGFVDLYYNDTYALKKTIQEISKCPLSQSQQVKSDNQFSSQLEKISVACYKLSLFEKVEFIPQKSQYLDALAEYFPELLGNDFKQMLVNPILLVSCAEKNSELPYFLQLCDFNKSSVCNLSRRLQKYTMSKLDLYYFRDASKNHLTLLRNRKLKIFQRDLKNFQKTRLRNTQAIIHYAEVIYEILNIKIEVLLLADQCQVLVNKLEKLLNQNPNQYQLQEITNCARLLFITTTNATVQNYKSLMQKHKYPDQVLLRVCRLKVDNPNFDINDFKVVQMMLSLIQKQFMFANILKALAYFGLGKTEEAIYFLQVKLKQSLEPKGSYWRFWMVFLLIEYLRRTNLTKAQSVCKQQLKTTPVKYRCRIQLQMVDIYEQFGRLQQSLTMLQTVIDTIRLNGTDQNLLDQVQIAQAQKLYILKQPKKVY